MLRTINSTGRKKIFRRQVTIRTSEDNGTAPSFDIDLDLEELTLPADAPIFVEAYDRRSYQRFPWGTVGEPKRPSDTSLSELAGERILFRVKVVEPGDDGRLLAAAERLKPRDDTAEEVTSLLPVDVRSDLGDLTWKVEFGSEAVLVLNGRVPGIKDAMRNDPIYRALVFPSLLREVLYRALFVEECREPGGDSWYGMWIDYATRLLGEEPPSGDDSFDLARWLDDVVAEFARRLNLAAELANEAGD